MVRVEGLLYFVQQCLRLVALTGELACGRRALGAYRLQEGTVCKSVFLRRLVALAGTLIGALIEKHISELSRRFLAGDRTMLMRLDYGIGARQGWGRQQETQNTD